MQEIGGWAKFCGLKLLLSLGSRYCPGSGYFQGACECSSSGVGQVVICVGNTIKCQLLAMQGADGRNEADYTTACSTYRELHYITNGLKSQRD